MYSKDWEASEEVTEQRPRLLNSVQSWAGVPSGAVAAGASTMGNVQSALCCSW